MTTYAIETTGLEKIYRAGNEVVRALNGLDLAVPRGETYGLIGPNGAGKTTLLRILATLLAPTRGRARVAGHDTETARMEVCRQIGFMPELFFLYEEMKVWEYLEFFAGCYGVPVGQRVRTIEDVMELTDLGVRRDSFCGTLSKGMRQRLLLAKTLIHDPEVLLLDEPTSGMDPQARVEFRNVLRTLTKMGKTIIISSHILSDLASTCTSVGIMERGCMRVTGTIAELQRRLRIHTEIEIQHLASGPDPLTLLRDRPGVLLPRRIGPGRVSFGSEGDAAQRAEVLAVLVRGGVPVVEFRERATDLEEIFLQVGATGVQ